MPRVQAEIPTPIAVSRGPRRLSKVARRKQLVSAAMPVVAAQGFADFSLGEVAAPADGGRNLLYHYFPSKEALLHELTRLAAEVESGLSASQFRIGACRAYSELVHMRIDEMREVRLPGLQTIQDFMDRRFAPAVATCTTVSQRLHDLSERVAQASGLLATRFPEAVQ